MARERRVSKNLLLVGSNHYALSADHSIPNNTLSEQTILAEKSAWQVANGNAATRYRSLRPGPAIQAVVSHSRENEWVFLQIIQQT